MKSILFLLVLISIVLAKDLPAKHFEQNGLVIDRDVQGTISLKVPEDWDCMKGCTDPSANRCLLGYCFLMCYDEDGDFLISEKEIQNALYNQLSWFERGLTHSASTWVSLFDGADLSIPDKNISSQELIESDEPTCSDLVDSKGYLCDRCPAFVKDIQQ